MDFCLAILQTVVMANRRSNRQDSISRIIKTLLTARAETQRDLCAVLDLSDAAVSRRLRSGEWSVDDLEALAQHFDVPVSTFFRDIADLLRDPSDQGKRQTIWEDVTREGEVAALA